MDKRKIKLTIRETVLFGVLGALTFALQVVMSPLPNIEPVSLLVMLFAVTFGWKSLYAVFTFVAMEILFYGFSLWNVYYLYVWVILAVFSIFLRRQKHPLVWAMISGVFGLLFGALCGIADIFIGGPGYAVVRWVSGIPFDLIHCGGNFGIALLLFAPLRSLLEKLYERVKK